MKFYIVQMTEKEGHAFPDSDKIAATVEIEGSLLKVEIRDARYQKQLSGLFEEPVFHPRLSSQSGDGSIADAGLEEINPRDPRVLQFLPARLSMMGLGIVAAGE